MRKSLLSLLVVSLLCFEGSTLQSFVVDVRCNALVLLARQCSTCLDPESFPRNSKNTFFCFSQLKVSHGKADFQANTANTMCLPEYRPCRETFSCEKHKKCPLNFDVRRRQKFVRKKRGGQVDLNLKL